MTLGRLLSWFVAFALLAAGQVPPAQVAPPRDVGTIRGRVTVPSGPAMTMGNRPSVADLGSRPHEPIDRRRVVVYLGAFPRRAFDEVRPGRAHLDQRDEQFVPHLLAITAGTVVDFPNNDKTFHNVFSLARVRPFDLGRYPPGKTGAVRFDRPGIVPVFCDIHSHMSAYILVFSHPYFAISDEAGRFEIPGVPAGSYSLEVWSELGHAAPKPIVVSAGAATEADFQVAREP